jgi:adenosylhomocysteinase
VVAGYGHCGRGVAMRARGMGARVVITEVNPLKALEALMDGYEVLPMEQAARIGDVFCTLTGDINVIREEHFGLMKDGAILANSGHFNVEIDIPSLERMSTARRQIRDSVEEFTLKNGTCLYVLAEGRLVNLARRKAPSAVMDMSFANQALSGIHSKTTRSSKAVYPVPEDIDKKSPSETGGDAGGYRHLTPEQEKYLASYDLGT